MVGNNNSVDIERRLSLTVDVIFWDEFYEVVNLTTLYFTKKKVYLKTLFVYFILQLVKIRFFFI